MAGASTAFVALAALCWGFSGGIGGILMADGWDAFVVSFYRGAIGRRRSGVYWMLRSVTVRNERFQMAARGHLKYWSMLWLGYAFRTHQQPVRRA